MSQQFVVRYLVRETGKYTDYQSYDTEQEAKAVVAGLVRQGNTCEIETEDVPNDELVSEFYPASIELAPEFRTDPPLRSLFQLGDFTLRSGQKSKWKIECDGLTGDDWSALAQMAVEILPPFGGVAGVPRGGWPFAAALALRATPGCKTFLVAEDVITTGGSILRYLEANPPPKDQWEHVLGVCVFARGPVSTPDWVTPLFSMPLGKVAFAAKTS